jgi:PAS domain S-box-containing protein
MKMDQSSGSDLNFNHLTGYARYLLDHKLEEYTRLSLKISRDMSIPLLRYFADIPDERLVAMGIERNRETLKLLAQNKALDVIEQSTRNWITNQLPLIQRDQIVTEDIILVNFTRRKTFRDLLNGYTDDVKIFTNVMEEVDRFTMAQDITLFNIFVKLQQEKINDANKALQRRENELLEAQEIGQTGSFEWDLVGKDSVYTPQIFKIFEFEKTDTLESFMNDVHPEDREKLSTAMKQALEHGTLECEYRYTRNNKNKVLWTRGKTSFKEGKAVKLVGTIMDVTQRSKIIAQLQQSEDLHKQAQALTHIGNWSWDINNNTVNWSDEMYRIYGLEPQSEAITLERFLSFVHTDDKEKRLKEIQESLAQGFVKEYVFRINTSKGLKVLRGRGEVIVDKMKQPLTLVGTCQDITNEFILNKELKDREIYLDQLLTNAPDAIVVINASSEIILWNPKTESIFGWKSTEVLGKKLSEIIIPEKYRKAHAEGMKRLLSTGVSNILNSTIEIEALNKSGEQFYIALTISQSVQAEQPIFISFIRDITEDRIIQAELNAKTSQLATLNRSLEITNAELVRTNKELESFNFIASHDLQEPLRKIRIFGGRILEAAHELPEGTKNYAEKMHLAAGRMQKLIDDFLSLSRTVAEPKTFELTDLNILMEEVKNDLAESILEKSAVIEVANLPTLEVIPFQFGQLMINLISNSMKYSRDGIIPHIVISSAIASATKIPFKAPPTVDNYVKISLADNGIGFEQKYADKIFELFQRLHSKESYTGTGIGLAICKKIVENHSGFIEAVGVLNEGAVFNIYLPTREFENLKMGRGKLKIVPRP